ncbi:cytochrome c biogenesis CcdA family protein [Dethiobacter alkaliphilus]|uniref:cytochrome c biogenesis CcdA family protein n=1 Tax=Dethiobacter alkaliphilus TaxID=427926 RepID=UPI002225F495|nr:cytochrome c biogenesis CcdA family protein [Dethiobacter alkaliphilus]MCW3491246.1 cytochrome c biogenesis CcdA family protein [Dethiobacter alkaliphilus]
MDQGTMSLMIAFFAGVISFFSPCQLPLLPIYLGFLAGSMTDEDGRPQKNKAFVNSLNFVVGFSVVFIFLGLLASWFAAFFAAHQVTLQRVAGVLIILFGLHLAGILSPSVLQREKRMQYMPKTAGPGTAMLMGVAFGAGWTPCIGPVLGSILVYAAATGAGVSLLIAFSVGMALPFLLAALLVEQVGRWVDRFAVYLPHLQRIFGFILVLFGIAVFSGILARLAIILY